MGGIQAKDQGCRGISLFHPRVFSIDTATSQIYTLSLHDALPIYLMNHEEAGGGDSAQHRQLLPRPVRALGLQRGDDRSEEHTSELQSRRDLVCRLMLEKKKILLPNGWNSGKRSRMPRDISFSPPSIFDRYRHLSDLHSFPTRRSSDLSHEPRRGWWGRLGAAPPTAPAPSPCPRPPARRR